MQGSKFLNLLPLLMYDFASLMHRYIGTKAMGVPHLQSEKASFCICR
jgi:hypothetical protein